jgi:hypothetical protein
LKTDWKVHCNADCFGRNCTHFVGCKSPAEHLRNQTKPESVSLTGGWDQFKEEKLPVKDEKKETSSNCAVVPPQITHLMDNKGNKHEVTQFKKIDGRLESIFPDNPSFNIDKIRDSVVPLYSSEGVFLATGFCVGNHLVTCAHVGSPLGTPCVKVVQPGQTKYVPLVVSIAEKDLCPDLICYRKPAGYKSLNMLMGDTFNTRAMIFSYWQDNDAQEPYFAACSTSLVPSWQGDLRYATHFASTIAGCSGSPLMADGKVIGVHRMGNPTSGNQAIKFSPAIQAALGNLVK